MGFLAEGCQGGGGMDGGSGGLGVEWMDGNVWYEYVSRILIILKVASSAILRKCCYTMF